MGTDWNWAVVIIGLASKHATQEFPYPTISQRWHLVLVFGTGDRGVDRRMWEQRSHLANANLSAYARGYGRDARFGTRRRTPGSYRGDCYGDTDQHCYDFDVVDS